MPVYRDNAFVLFCFVLCCVVLFVLFVLFCFVDGLLCLRSNAMKSRKVAGILFLVTTTLPVVVGLLRWVCLVVNLMLIAPPVYIYIHIFILTNLAV